MKTLEEIHEIYHCPLIDLIHEAQCVHRKHHIPNKVQVCQLISIKTGGCSEDCKYCAQSSRYQTSVKAKPMMSLEEILGLAKNAIARGATRICLGAAWRQVRDSVQFEEILKMVKAITDLGAEVCCTLGMLNETQAKQLKQAGLFAYNHNLDSSAEFYKTIITTRSYEERLKTLDVVQNTGLSLCCGAILGMGESVEDRLKFLHTLTKRDQPPDSIPLNRLESIPGTPLENQPMIPIWEFIRMVATTRIVFPKAMIRLSAGREQMSTEEHALAFLAGANSLFIGEVLLTIKNPPFDRDQKLFKLLGINALQD